MMTHQEQVAYLCGLLEKAENRYDKAMKLYCDAVETLFAKQAELNWKTQLNYREPPMTRDEAVEICRRAIIKNPEAYAESPFHPHDWVIEAVLEAGNGPKP